MKLKFVFFFNENYSFFGFFETFSRKTNYKLFEIIAKQLHLKEFKNTIQNKYY